MVDLFYILFFTVLVTPDPPVGKVGGVKRGGPIDLWLPSRLVEAEPSSSGCAPEETLDEMPPSRHSILTIVWQLHDFSEANQDQERLCHPVGLGTCRSIAGCYVPYQDGVRVSIRMVKARLNHMD